LLYFLTCEQAVNQTFAAHIPLVFSAGIETELLTPELRVAEGCECVIDLEAQLSQLTFPEKMHYRFLVNDDSSGRYN